MPTTDPPLLQPSETRFPDPMYIAATIRVGIIPTKDGGISLNASLTNHTDHEIDFQCVMHHHRQADGSFLPATLELSAHPLEAFRLHYLKVTRGALELGNALRRTRQRLTAKERDLLDNPPPEDPDAAAAAAREAEARELERGQVCIACGHLASPPSSKERAAARAAIERGLSRAREATESATIDEEGILTRARREGTASLHDVELLFAQIRSLRYSAMPGDGAGWPPLSLRALSRMNRSRCVEGFGHSLESWSAAEWTNAVAGEAGEACNLTKKLLRHRDEIPGNVKPEDQNDDLLRIRAAQELADTIIYADLAIQRLGFQTEDVVRTCFNAKSEEIGVQHKV